MVWSRQLHTRRWRWLRCWKRQRQLLRPSQQMRAASPAVRTAKARKGSRQARSLRGERALFAAGERPRAGNLAGDGQVINMPAQALFFAHVACDPRANSARSAGAAEIQVTPRRQNRFGSPRQGDCYGGPQLEQQDISARIRRQRRDVAVKRRLRAITSLRNILGVD